MTIDYDVLAKKYTINGQSVTQARATKLLRAEGLSPGEAAIVLDAHRFCARIEAIAPPPPPPPDMLDARTVERVLAAVLWQGLLADLARRAARRWIAANLRPSKKPSPWTIYGAKHFFSAATGFYIREADYRAALVANGLKLTRDGKRVYAEEVGP